ncbi:hypothetical protein HNR44_002349 [Geomicrobium halophilum]|uniref:DUF8042 domain-containing protein n=1 Tax=Geomicrobium halophilum TaxID=549000 RepID=A0A841PT53_9BACL|nr:hypothetical protein [Geomicrobium halophilum]MBB6450366.1 hypothetical protein [Geomicrobium halophilum]
MESLTAKQYRFIRRYYDWMETVIEGLQTVIQFYRDQHEEQGDRLLSDMLAGFERFGEDNLTMHVVFGQQEDRVREWNQFQQEVYAAQNIPANSDPMNKIAQMTKTVLPAFQRWQMIVQSALDDVQSQKPDA